MIDCNRSLEILLIALNIFFKKFQHKIVGCALFSESTVDMTIFPIMPEVLVNFFEIVFLLQSHGDRLIT